jgi:hypothetical protein
MSLPVVPKESNLIDFLRFSKHSLKELGKLADFSKLHSSVSYLFRYIKSPRNFGDYANFVEFDLWFFRDRVRLIERSAGV